MKKNELLEEIEKLKSEVEDLEEQRQLLLLYNGQITHICLQHTATRKFMKTPIEKEYADLHLIFNVHSFTAYFDKLFYDKYDPKVEKNKEFLKVWNKHVLEVLNPLFKEEKQKIDDKHTKKKEVQPYIS